jgi:hypothetical protein
VTPEERFWSKVEVRGPDECWPWRRPNHPSGYCYVYFDRRTLRAHRVSHFLATGEWPSVVRHTCDNTVCQNPRHLLGGEHADNIRDMHTRGRANQVRQGPANGRTRIPFETIQIIRQRVADGVPLLRIEGEFGVPRHYIKALAQGRYRRDS